MRNVSPCRSAVEAERLPAPPEGLSPVLRQVYPYPWTFALILHSPVA